MQNRRYNCGCGLEVWIDELLSDFAADQAVVRCGAKNTYVATVHTAGTAALRTFNTG